MEPSKNEFIEFRDIVHDHIIWTQHKEVPDNNDACYLVDLDFSVLGLPFAQYIRTSEAIRVEFGEYSDEEFFPARKAFLEGLLERDGLFYTHHFHKLREEQAQQNIRREIEMIKQRL